MTSKRPTIRTAMGSWAWEHSRLRQERQRSSLFSSMRCIKESGWCLLKTIGFGPGRTEVRSLEDDRGMVMIWSAPARLEWSDASSRRTWIKPCTQVSWRTLAPISSDSSVRDFQQGMARCHTARSIKVWIEDHKSSTLSRLAQSPDRNPTENLWNVIKRKIDDHGHSWTD